MSSKQQAWLRVVGVAILIFTLSCLFTHVKSAQAQGLDRPQITAAFVSSSPQDFGRLHLQGTAPVNSEILAYLDDSFLSLVLPEEKDGKIFFDFLGDNILSAGQHEVMVLARDKTSLTLSLPTTVLINTPTLPAPTLVSPINNGYYGGENQTITGLAISNSRVKIYLDGALQGETEVLKHPSGVANFAFKIKISKGFHILEAQAVRSDGNEGEKTALVNFKIEGPMIRPTLFTPVVNYLSSAAYPFIVGLAKNDSYIRIYIDNKLDGEFWVDNHPSGTANFAYKPTISLLDKGHWISATAADTHGKISPMSIVVYYQGVKPTPEILATKTESPKAEIDINEKAIKTDNQDAALESAQRMVQEAEDKGINITSDQVGLATTVKVIVNDQKSDLVKNEEQILSPTLATITSSSTVVANDSGESLDFYVKIIIFFIFITGILIWILWVNKELRHQNEDEKDDFNKSIK